MYRGKLRHPVLAVVAFFIAVSVNSAASGQILHNFSTDDGIGPRALTLDSAGNLYGVASSDGPGGYGTAFIVSSSDDGTWRLNLLHAFTSAPGDGKSPYGGLALDTSGNLYGTTASGGAFGFGSVFRLSPSPAGWEFELIYSFTNLNGDGGSPYSQPVVDYRGNVYGTTLRGGREHSGTVFQLRPQPDGTWKKSLLYSIPSSDQTTSATITLGPDGKLYGSRPSGGANESGVIFMLSPNGDSRWTETTLHEFGSSGSGDGSHPTGVALDAAGNIFGATILGGGKRSGTLFELPRNADGTFGPESIIHSFAAGGDGSYPIGSPALDSTGNIYGVTQSGGSADLGILYKFSPAEGGTWVGRILHNFGCGSDGGYPLAGPTVDGAGNIYGTTSRCGLYDEGTVWEIKP